jgi:hypothetical protein
MEFPRRKKTAQATGQEVGVSSLISPALYLKRYSGAWQSVYQPRLRPIRVKCFTLQNASRSFQVPGIQDAYLRPQPSPPCKLILQKCSRNGIINYLFCHLRWHLCLEGIREHPSSTNLHPDLDPISYNLTTISQIDYQTINCCLKSEAATLI